jgi:hypothetical protein
MTAHLGFLIGHATIGLKGISHTFQTNAVTFEFSFEFANDQFEPNRPISAPAFGQRRRISSVSIRAGPPFKNCPGVFQTCPYSQA